MPYIVDTQQTFGIESRVRLLIFGSDVDSWSEPSARLSLSMRWSPVLGPPSV